MSGILAFLALDGETVPDGAFEAMMDVARHLGPDGAAVWRSGNVALGHLKLSSIPECESQRQPAHATGGSVHLTLDGRIDNRDELLESLGVSKPKAPITDVELVLAAYAHWDLDCVQHLVGDFALAIWDEHRKRLFCARDPLGVRPLFYSETAKAFVAASGMRELLALGPVSRDINEGMVGEYFDGQCVLEVGNPLSQCAAAPSWTLANCGRTRQQDLQILASRAAGTVEPFECTIRRAVL